MKFTRLYSKSDRPVEEQIEWETRQVGKVVAEVPKPWSANATGIIAGKYFRRAGVPSQVRDRTDTIEIGLPNWLRQQEPDLGHVDHVEGGETSAKQVFNRLAGCWTWHGWMGGYFDSEEDARIFYDECYMMLALQIAAPNSPQWFNTGLYWAYGIAGPDSGQWAVDEFGTGYRVFDSYTRPQPHACFIQPVLDDLVNEGGIMDLWTREVRLFKHGSGSGSNVSSVRGKDELISGGGKSSGLISFLEIGDKAAGSIQSGGVTRRAALMRTVDMDHPDIEEFVTWKVREETKAAAISVGSRYMRQFCLPIAQACKLHAEACEDLEVVHDLIAEARAAGIPEAIIDRAKVGDVPEEYNLDWQSEAIRTVSGQNSNNSVRPTDEFLRFVDKDLDWKLIGRTDGKVTKTLKARALWDALCHSAWACADPGVQFDTTINDWHTVPNDGRIRASNPCSEYMSVDDTACNLASHRVTAFWKEDGQFDYAGYMHATRVWTVVLDISVAMASYPSQSIAETNWKYRNLGYGFADLGGFLLRMGIPYNSDAGRGWAAGLAALMTGVAYLTSAEMAESLGAFPRFDANKEAMLRVIHNHRAVLEFPILAFKDLSTTPYTDPVRFMPINLREMCKSVWNMVGMKESFRNSQVSLLAPTGTIAFVMDCDTTGVEPDFALVKEKKLVGPDNKVMTIVNQSVPHALRHLGYSEKEITAIGEYLLEHKSLPTQDGFFHTYVKDAHMTVFDCVSNGQAGGRCIPPVGHIYMVAAVQPFLSGAVSKTINLPNSATVDDVKTSYRLAHKLGLKSVALFREGCKLNQPLSAATNLPVVSEMEKTAAAEYFKKVFPSVVISIGDPPMRRGEREYLPWRREHARIQKVKLGNQSVFLIMAEYDDGRLGEVFIEIAHEGTFVRAAWNIVAMMISVGLQYGVPVSEFVDRLRDLRFEPSGPIEGHDYIKAAASVADYIGREFGLTYLHDEDAGQVKPARSIETGEVVAMLDLRAVGLARGYTGDVCENPSCGAATMLWAGACLVCDTCKESTGCG